MELEGEGEVEEGVGVGGYCVEEIGDVVVLGRGRGVKEGEGE